MIDKNKGHLMFIEYITDGEVEYSNFHKRFENKPTDKDIREAIKEDMEMFLDEGEEPELDDVRFYEVTE